MDTDNQRIRYLLRACRPNGADDDDPTLGPAVAAAQRDPVLGAWFAHERAIDAALAAKWRDLRAPVELRQQILDGLVVSHHGRRPRPVALVVAALAAAASIALAVYTVWPRSRPVVHFDAFVTAAVEASAGDPALSFYSAAVADLRDWLRQQSAPAPGELPAGLATLETVGCRVFVRDGVRASDICFRAPPRLSARADGTGGGDERAVDWLRLFTVPQQSCAGGSAGATPVIFAQGGATVATWSDAGHYYVLVSPAPESAVREWLLAVARIRDAKYFALAD